MPDFTVPVPRWNDIQQLEINGAAQVIAGGKVALPTDAGTLEISMLPAGVRVRIGAARPHDYGMLQQEPVVTSVQLETNDVQSTLSSDRLRLTINHRPFHFTLFTADKVVQQSASDGHFVRQFRLPPLARLEEGWFLALELGPSEPVYGLGEKWGRLNKRGEYIRSFNCDALGVNAEISYKNVPFAWSPEGWGVFVHTPAPVTHGVGFAPWSQRAYGILVEDESLDLFLFAAADGAQMLALYTALTGRAPVPPDYSLGVILSRAYYKNVPEILQTARAVREKGMPCDVITLDGRAWQDTATRFVFEWDPQRFDDPAALICELKALHFKVCIWEYPMISVKGPLFAELAAKGWLIKDRRNGLPFRYQWDLSPFGKVLTPLPESGILDFTHPDAYAFWRDSHKPLFDLGVDMIKADFGEQIEDANMLAHNGERGAALHNVYALLYNRCVYEAAQKYCQSGAFLFSRAAWIGSQRYPSHWGGDPQADWGGLAANLRGGISWGLSGSPYFATDVGGFYKDNRDPELFVRWAQAAVFSAHIRLHGIGPREPWSYGPEAEAAATAALKLRYRLLPYVKAAMQEAHRTGLPVQRAMVLAFPEDPAAWAFEDQFMFGKDLLVAPCLEPGGRVRFYLPQGAWVMFPSGREFAGSKVHEMRLQLNEMAVFAKKGGRIPLGAAVQHTAEREIPDEIVDFWRAA